jgi:hypothetical protein
MNPAKKQFKKFKTRFYSLPKFIRIALLTITAIFFLFLLGWFTLNWYVKSHKAQILATITAKISKKVDGVLTIQDMEPALLKSFPDISVRLINVTLQDSLYYHYKKNTVDLASVYIKLNLLSFFSAHPQIKKITLTD